MRPLVSTKLDPAFAAVREACRRDAKDLYFTSAFLPRPKRDAACVVYAFCRLLHDALAQPASTDESQPSTIGIACCTPNSCDSVVSLFRTRLDDLYANRLELPLPEFRDESQNVLAALALTVHRYQIPQSLFLTLADGWRTWHKTRRFATWTSLANILDQTTGSLALILSCIFGLTDPDARPHLLELARGISLAGILRRLKSDTAAGQIRLPLEDLATCRCSQSDLTAGQLSGRLQPLIRLQIDRARDLFRAGMTGLAAIPNDGSRLAAALLTVHFASILKLIQRRRFDVFSRPICLTTSHKLRALPTAWRLTRLRPHRPVPAIF